MASNGILKDIMNIQPNLNDKLNIKLYDIDDTMENAYKSRKNEVGSWNYLTSSETSLSNVKHLFKITGSWGKIGDLWLSVNVPANTYVYHTLSSMIKEVKINFGSGLGQLLKYTGEQLDMLMCHLNKKVISDLLLDLQGNTAVISSATTLCIPLFMLGSKLLFSEEEDLYNNVFHVYKCVNDIEIEITLWPLANFVTSGANSTGTVELFFKQYDYLSEEIIPNKGGIVVPKLYIMPDLYTDTVTFSATALTEYSYTANNVKNDGEVEEIQVKIAPVSTYAATAPLYYTTAELSNLKFTLKNTNVYEGFNPNWMRAMYLNEYGHDNVMKVNATDYRFYVIDLSETPKFVYTQGSLGTVGINFAKENPVIKVTPTTGSSTSTQLWIQYVYKSIYTIDKFGIVKKFLKY